MDKARLDAIRARCEAATPGPWFVREDRYASAPIIDAGYRHEVAKVLFYNGSEDREVMPNADFIAHARTDVPDLLAEVEKLREQLEHADLVLDACKQDRDEWRRRTEKAESCITKMLQLMPIGMCKQFCKRAGVNCGAYGDCSPEWNGTT